MFRSITSFADRTRLALAALVLGTVGLSFGWAVTRNAEASGLRLEARGGLFSAEIVDGRADVRSRDAVRGRESAALRLQTVSIRAGEEELVAGAPEIWEQRGVVALQRSAGVVERFTSRPEGVEQTWEFPRRPAPAGALVVRVAARGLDFVAQSAEGLRFRDPATGLGIVYGSASWVSADGRRTGCPARFVDGEIAIEVPESALAQSRYPAVLDPLIAPELVLDPAISNGPRSGSYPAAAGNSTGGLVVWLASNYQLAGARVDLDGNVLDVPQIQLGATGIMTSPNLAVASDGSNYLVAYWGGSSDILGVRVSATGARLDASPLQFSVGASWSYRPALAFDGTNYLLVFDDEWTSGTHNIVGQLISPDGQVLSTTNLYRDSVTMIDPAVAWNGTEYLVVWMDYQATTAPDIYATRVTQAGAPLDRPAKVVSGAVGNQIAPAIASDGSGFLVVWQDKRNATQDIYAARVDAAGVTLDPSGIPVATGAGDQTAPTVSWNGTSYVVAWQDTRGGGADVYSAEVSPAGVVSPAAGAVVSAATGDQTYPALAQMGTRSLLAWGDGRVAVGFGTIYGARLEAGSVLDADGFPIPQGPNTQRMPAVAWGGSDFLVTWDDTLTGAVDVSAVRVGPTGTVLDAPAIVVATGSDAQASSAVSRGSDHYLVVWRDRRASSTYDLRGVRVGLDGTVLDPAPFVIAAADATTTLTKPEVSWNGTSHLVVWANKGVWGARVSAQGTVLDASPVQIASATGAAYPDVAWNGQKHLVVWKGGGIWGNLVGADGAVADLTGVRLSATTSADDWPKVASDGDGFLVAWDVYGTATGWDVFASRVGPDGQVVGTPGFTVSNAAFSQQCADVVWDGTYYVVVWHDLRNGNRIDTIDVYANRVSAATGAVLDADLPVSLAAPPEYYPAVASDGRGRTLIAYSRLEGSPYFAERMVARLFLDLPNGEACSGGTSCASGSCVAGVCAGCIPAVACAQQSGCQRGSISCASGNPVCQGLVAAPNGISCGTDKVCSAGQCVTCAAGGPCSMNDGCRVGTLSCSTGAPVCAGLADVATGTGCGADKVCLVGSCVACAAGGACSENDGCRTGTYSCATGVQVCAVAATTDDGTACGVDKVCAAGLCVDCAAGGACSTNDGCQTGTLSCASGASTCVLTATTAAGTPCGVDKVCSAGSCVDCAAGGACSQNDGCRTGTYDCATGAQVCTITATTATGTSCGADKVCLAGSCVGCAAGGACSENDGCRTGTYGCATGAQVCTITGTTAAGTSCGADRVCLAGSCVDCAAGGACTENNGCMIGIVDCATGLPVCASLVAASDGTACAGGSCVGGACLAGTFPDAGFPDAGVEPADASAEPGDAATPPDAASLPDAATPPDAASPSDAASLSDAATPPDAATTADAAASADAAVAPDDAALVADAAASEDAAAEPSDAGANPDAEVVPAADAGDGGAVAASCGCGTTSRSSVPDGLLLACAALLLLARRAR